MFEMTGGVWVIAPVEDEPQLCLDDWSVFEVLVPDIGVRTRHFVGTNLRGREGRASSPMVAFDAVTCKGMTASGRVYQLVGKRTGLCSDSSYVWNIWKSRNQVVDVVDVTNEIKKLIAGGSNERA
ncbi:hypothetical protein [Rhodoferax sp. TS-BS-61-7]|uniref:hypothetical protein n=1 Tax=Rhodoferax sp. TS-BS-61-7 TaxID=2094194 RepID=UPI000CF7041F|nr:hypothetical protein [Rhodoferax sp. TS-BS-61-7]PQA78070.1 hypothetical protein C5F53_06970 [Rhodoferax sp. TS-BS-61-7]